MSVTAYMANLVERIAASMAHYVMTTRDDRRDWRPAAEPDSNSRSALDMMSECILTNRRFVRCLSGNSITMEQVRAEPHLTFASAEEACELLKASAKELADTYRSLGDSMMANTYNHWRGQLKGSTLLEMPYRNMAYHCGQINAIQMLYGDTEFHMPTTWVDG